MLELTESNDVFSAAVSGSDPEARQDLGQYSDILPLWLIRSMEMGGPQSLTC